MKSELESDSPGLSSSSIDQNPTNSINRIKADKDVSSFTSSKNEEKSTRKVNENLLNKKRFYNNHSVHTYSDDSINKDTNFKQSRDKDVSINEENEVNRMEELLAKINHVLDQSESNYQHKYMKDLLDLMKELSKNNKEFSYWTSQDNKDFNFQLQKSNLSETVINTGNPIYVYLLQIIDTLKNEVNIYTYHSALQKMLISFLFKIIDLVLKSGKSEYKRLIILIKKIIQKPQFLKFFLPEVKSTLISQEVKDINNPTLPLNIQQNHKVNNSQEGKFFSFQCFGKLNDLNNTNNLNSSNLENKELEEKKTEIQEINNKSALSLSLHSDKNNHENDCSNTDIIIVDEIKMN